MESLHLKDAIFYPDKIVIFNRKGDITINTEDILGLSYKKPTLLNLLWAGLWAPVLDSPGWLYITVNKKINKNELYLVKIKYDDFVKLPEFYLNKVNPWQR